MSHNRRSLPLRPTTRSTRPVARLPPPPPPRPTPRPPYYNINLEHEGFLTFFTKEELARGADMHIKDFGTDKCAMCHRLVALYGWARYSTFCGYIHALGKVCKACDVFKRNNKAPPPCTCAPDAIACETTDSGCPLHVVPAMTRVPDGVPRLLVPFREYCIEADVIGMNELDRALLGYGLSQGSADRTATCPIPAWRPASASEATRPRPSDHLPHSASGYPYGSPDLGASRRARKRAVENEQASAMAEEKFKNYMFD
ncbi:hypothetical protein DFH09DRAFT_1339387 [Mycena vulgaris]|nr:hypothetical protein DFH09DRAFT_1339387 [Mycena vulgaris]